MEIVLFQNMPFQSLLPEDYVVFGGTFDPIHEGHITVIRRLVPVFPTIVIAPTTANPWKSETPTSVELRCEMITLALLAEHIPPGSRDGASGVMISTEPYSYSEELVDFLRSKRKGRLFWAVGADSAESVKDWRNWTKKDVTTIVLPIEVDAHAALVRKGKAEPHPAIRNFVREKKLYGATTN